MAKSNTRKVEIALQKKLRNSTEIYRDKRFLNNLAKETAEQIKRRTQLGKGVSDSGKNQKLKGLSESYKKQRRGELAFFTNSNGKVVPITSNVRKPKLDKNTTPNRSNLTATGQLLNALRGIYKRRNIIIDFDKERRGPGLTGQRGKATNSDIVGYQEKQGRPFFDLSRSELNGLRRKIANRIRKLLEK